MKLSATFLSLMLMTSTVFADTFQVGSTSEEGYTQFSEITQMLTAFSKSAGVEAKVFELIGADGINPHRLILSLENGRPYLGKPVFEIEEKIVSLRRVTFLTKNQIVINYSQQDIDPKDDSNFITVNRSMTVTFSIAADGSIAPIINISK